MMTPRPLLLSVLVDSLNGFKDEWKTLMISKRSKRKLSALLASIIVPLTAVQVPVTAQEGVGSQDPPPTVAASSLPVDEAGVDRFIVGFDGSQPDTGLAAASDSKRTSVFASAAENLKVEANELRQMYDGSSVVKMNRPLGAHEAAAFINEVQSKPGVAYVQIDTWNEAHIDKPVDELYPAMWNMRDISNWGANVEAAWDLGYTGDGVTVAVIDSGITSHPDLTQNVLPNSGYDFVSSATNARDGDGRDGNPNDEGDWFQAGECRKQEGRDSTWHGTHVAGIIGATWNSDGIPGVAKNASIVPIRALSKCGGPTSDIADALAWAAGVPVDGVPANEHPADILNLSLGGGGQICSPTYQNAIDKANAQGARIFVSAGNSNQDTFLFEPASCEGVITIASSNSDGNKSSYSNHGGEVDLSAPGGDQWYIDENLEKAHDPNRGIWSTLNSGKTTQGEPNYAPYDGTSMATPMVAGIAAMMLEANSTLSTDDLRSALQKTAKPFTRDQPVEMGAGIVDAKAAIEEVMLETSPSTSELAPTDEIIVTETPEPVTETAIATATVTNTETAIETTTREIVVTDVAPGEQVTVTETEIAEPSEITETKTVVASRPNETSTVRETMTESAAPVTVIAEPVTETRTSVVVGPDVTETVKVTSTNLTTLPQETVTSKASAQPQEPVTTTVTDAQETVTLAPVTETNSVSPITETVTVTIPASTESQAPSTVSTTVDVTTTAKATETLVVDENRMPIDAVTTTVTMSPVQDDSSSTGSSDDEIEKIVDGSSKATAFAPFAILLGILAIVLPNLHNFMSWPLTKNFRGLFR
ncbi:S8 family serine peptidase [Corynebacterium incognita]|uniref:S8 family serine peptidase n=1 Tax=Corynebacterium incognita TaxID=2754725 RepID=A0A7G7CMS1_9CORY|nr:S8 family peptidase [Corynebacterium incognita]QNE88887.1 S8 family serine peptidase [Corynebacterium incognita]